MAGSPTLRHESVPPMGLWSIWGSSCNLNSVLQCLTFTPPLAEFCKSELHYLHCTRLRKENCTFCILEERILTSLMLDKVADDTPRKLYEHVMTTASELFKRDRHEDAHKLLSSLIHSCGDPIHAMQPGTSNQPQLSLPILFGGRMQNRIECQQCGARSIPEEDMVGLGLDILQHSYLIDALDSFFLPEVLDGDNKYHCKSCNSLSDARKRVSILQMPRVLVIQLKRFDPEGNKLRHHVHFDKRLCLAEYLSRNYFMGAPVPHYTLYALIVHGGDTKDHGHYVACVKETNGQWYVCNDETVEEASEETVLTANAYLLFYIRSDIDQSSASNEADESDVEAINLSDQADESDVEANNLSDVDEGCVSSGQADEADEGG